MQHRLYPDNWQERPHACLDQAGYRREDCSIPYGAMRVGKHRHTLYYIHLHAEHINLDPHNPYAKLRALCPACHMRHDRKTERKRDATRRQGYQVVSHSRLVVQSRCGGLHIPQEESSCACCIGDVSGVVGDIRDAIGSVLHCLMMEPVEVPG